MDRVFSEKVQIPSGSLFYKLPKFINAPTKVHQYFLKKIDPVVQLVRMPPCHGGGRGFESRPDRKSLKLF